MAAAPTVILDVDGTLVDSNDAHARAWADAFAEAGVEVSFDRIRRAIGMGGDKLLPQVAGIRDDSPLGERSAAAGALFTSRYLAGVRPFPRVRELIERFAGDGFTVVVASSASKADLRALLDRAGVADLISGQTSSDDADESKPDPDIVLAALKRWAPLPARPSCWAIRRTTSRRRCAPVSGSWAWSRAGGGATSSAGPSRCMRMPRRCSRATSGRSSGAWRAASTSRRRRGGSRRRCWRSVRSSFCVLSPPGGAGGASSGRRDTRRAASRRDPRWMDEDEVLPSGRFADSGILHADASRLRRRDYQRLRRLISRYS